MRIAILTPTFFRFSGPDRVVKNEAEEHVAKGNKVTVFTFKGDIKAKNYNVVELWMPSNATLERIYRLLFFLDFFKIIKTAKMLKEYDEVVSFLYPMTIIASTARKYYKKKYVYYNVGVAYPKLFNLFERTYMNFFNILTNLSVKNADSAISISDFLRKELLRETGLDSTVKHVKVDSKEYNTNLDKKKIQAIVKKHKLKKPVILFVGRLSPHKGVHLLLKAFNIIKKEIDATLVIVGKPTFDKYSKKLMKLSKNHRDSVVFTGFVSDEDLPYYFGACDLYATATLWEGFDIPTVQAQMCGKKVVAFDVGSHPEVVKKGILVKDGDVKGFADAVKRMLKS
ncbi:hypothetical protein CMO88_01070 [Candidatus Woesearchaeota archaeon]|nr:hypothetical protein [Candidatus Woesearchaeota archaeon]|tara:strand:- start:10498 stop:11517 length:1020 start_codon:yes stop_codon:yes gene_type:complete